MRVEETSRTKMRLVTLSRSVNDFCEETKKEIRLFREHVTRLREQYTCMRHMKENMRDDEILIQMDYSENYSCRQMNEIQSAYWAVTGVQYSP